MGSSRIRSPFQRTKAQIRSTRSAEANSRAKTFPRLGSPRALIRRSDTESGIAGRSGIDEIPGSDASR